MFTQKAESLTLPWSNGPVEGQILRLKLVRRQMYGRGHLDLLKRRLLPLGVNSKHKSDAA